MPFKSGKQRRYMHANLPEIAKRWERDYANGGIARVGLANGSAYPLNILGSEVIDPNIYKQNLLNQYTGIMSQYPERATMTSSPVFQAGLKNWDPYGISSQSAFGMNKLLGAVSHIPGLASLKKEATKSPFGKGMYVPSLEDTKAKYKNIGGDTPTMEALSKQAWADTFGHETSHLGWEYKPKSEREAWETESALPGLDYGGEEQWNYMHDLVYGPRTAGTGADISAVDYLTNRGLANKGDLSYTPEAYDLISRSGLIPEHKKAIGFGVNPHEDTMMGKMRSYPNSQAPNTSNIRPDIIKRTGVDNIKAMIANAKKKEAQVPIAIKLANLDKIIQEPRPGFPHDSSVYDKWGNIQMAQEKMDPARPQRKGLGTGITAAWNSLKESPLGSAVGQAFKGQQLTPQQKQMNKQFLQNYNVGVGTQQNPFQMTSGPFQGMNAPGKSAFGSPTSQAMAQKWMKKYGDVDHQTQKMIDKKEQISKIAQGNVGTGDKGQHTTQGRSQSPTGADVHGTPFYRGGIAGLWPR